MNDFTDRINANPNWEFAGIYSDEGISGTELSHRKGMLQMIEDARAGKIEISPGKLIQTHDCEHRPKPHEIRHFVAIA